MKISTQVPAAQARNSVEPASQPVVSEPVAAAAEPLLQVRPKGEDAFGGTARQVPGALSAEGSAALAADQVRLAGGSYAEHFFKGMSPAVHVVVPGDTLTKIAASNYPEGGMSADYLATHNGIENPNLIRPGQELLLPETFVYTVQKGDTLGRIAAFTSLSVEEIAKANGITNPDLISVGQELRLGGPWGEAGATLSNRFWDHAQQEKVTVQKGDTLFKIAAQTFPEVAGNRDELQLIVDAYVNWNQIENPNLIHVGQELQVPARYSYTVQPGDTLWSISSGFGERMHEIVKHNGLNGPSDIHPGQVLQLHGAIWGC